MTPLQIKKSLEDLDIRQIDVVTRLGLPKTSRPIVSMVINGYSRSRRVEKEISDLTGHPLHVLWPCWYQKNGKAIKRRRSA